MKSEILKLSKTIDCYMSDGARFEIELFFNDLIGENNFVKSFNVKEKNSKYIILVEIVACPYVNDTVQEVEGIFLTFNLT